MFKTSWHHRLTPSNFSSENGIDTSCRPSGNPALLRPDGKESAGNPQVVHGVCNTGSPVEVKFFGAGEVVDGVIKASNLFATASISKRN